jgi:uncharacterized protein
MPYVFGDYELDAQLYQLHRAGALAELEPKVFDLLVCLVEHRDRIVSKSGQHRHHIFVLHLHSRRHKRVKHMGTKIPVDHERLAAFCQRHHIRKLAFFGSVLREDFRPDSDVDVLIEFEPGQRVGLIRLAGMELELSDILGRKADLRTPADLSRYFRQAVVASAEVQYAQG